MLRCKGVWCVAMRELAKGTCERSEVSVIFPAVNHTYKFLQVLTNKFLG